MWLVTSKVRALGNNVRHRWLCERQASVLQAQSPPRLVLLSSCALSAQNKFRALSATAWSEMLFIFDFMLLVPFCLFPFPVTTQPGAALNSVGLAWLLLRLSSSLGWFSHSGWQLLVSSLTHFLSSPMMMTVISENPEKMTQNVALFWGGDVHCTLMCRHCKQLNCYDVYLLYCNACLACQPASQHQHFPRCSELPVRTTSCMAN